MDVEKASQEDNSFPTHPKWALCHGSRPSSQNIKHILKYVLAILLLGMLALSTFQAISNASPPKVGDRSANWMELHGNLNLHFGDAVPPSVFEESWTFNAFPEKNCHGDAAPKSGTGIQACQQINVNQTYVSVSVPVLSDQLRICFYPGDDCSANFTAVTSLISCTPANASYYTVKFRPEAC